MAFAFGDHNGHRRSGQQGRGKALLLSVIAVLAMKTGDPCKADSIGVTRTTSAGIPVLVMTVDMNDPRVKVSGVVARNGNGTSEQFNSMIRRTHPSAAVTGTFFCTRALTPVGDIVVGGQLAHRGGVGTGLCITENNECSFVLPPHRYARMDWSAYDFVCCAGPRLVVNGVPSVHPGAEGFHDHSLLHSASRLAVGLTRHNKLLFVATRNRVQLGQMAKAMKRLGCVEAIALDAGSSLGFYNNGKMHMQPSRHLTNAILIYDDRERYDRFKDRLLPGHLMTSRR